MTDIRAAFRRQSGACADLESPFMARLMALAAERLTPGTAVADRILTWQGDVTPSGQSVPLRFAGSLHALKLGGHTGLSAVYPPQEATDDALWSAVENALVTDTAFLLDRLGSPPQTNEVRRSAVLIPALHMIARHFDMPMDLYEIGCSAGLNLRPDHFRLDIGGASYGPAASGVDLAPRWSGPTPRRADLRVSSRTGIDINPLDPVADETRLLSYLWPDQPDRIARTRAAIRIAAAVPAQILRGDAKDWLETGFRPVPGRVSVLYHTIAWQYLPPKSQKAGDRAIAHAGAAASADTPMARIAMEAGNGGARLTLQLWPGEVMLELGRADYHGRWVEWLHGRLAEGPADDT